MTCSDPGSQSFVFSHHLIVAFFSIYDKTYFAVGRLGVEKKENRDYDNDLIFLCSPKNWVPLLLPFKDIPNLFRPPYWLSPPPQPPQNSTA